MGLLLKQFSELGDDGEPWRVMYPLEEVLLFVTCASMMGIGKTKDLLQSYYSYNYSEDGYSRYYVYKY